MWSTTSSGYCVCSARSCGSVTAPSPPMVTGIAPAAEIADTARATDLFFGTLLHREVLARTYGVIATPLRERGAVAEAVVDEFLDRYLPTTAASAGRRR